MKSETPTTPAEHNGWNRLLILVISLALLCIGYLTVVHNTFATAEKLQAFLKEAKAFSYTADIVKAEVADKLPQKIKDNVIEQALIAKFMDFVITPDNVERLAAPGLTLIYKAAGTPTSIVNNKVVIDTATYKSQAAGYISGLKLPEAISGPGQDLVNSVPSQLTLVDNSKHPNNPLALLIYMRSALRTISSILVGSWWAVVIALLIVLVLNLRNLKRMSKTLAWAFGIPAVIVVIGSWLFPVLIDIFAPKSQDPIIGDSTNGLINSIVTNLFAHTRSFGLVCLVIAVIAALVYLFVPLQKVQDQLDMLLDKLRMQKSKAATPHKPEPKKKTHQ